MGEGDEFVSSFSYLFETFLNIHLSNYVRYRKLFLVYIFHHSVSPLKVTAMHRDSVTFPPTSVRLCVHVTRKTRSHTSVSNGTRSSARPFVDPGVQRNPAPQPSRSRHPGDEGRWQADRHIPSGDSVSWPEGSGVSDGDGGRVWKRHFSRATPAMGGGTFQAQRQPEPVSGSQDAMAASVSSARPRCISCYTARSDVCELQPGT